MVIYGKVNQSLRYALGRDLLLDRGSDAILDEFRIVTVSPKRSGPRQISHLPANVGRAFREAEEVRANQHWTAAAGGYRTTLERALKIVQEGVDWNSKRPSLYDRIDRLARENTIPQAMADLMHEVRFLGNEIHGDEDVSREDADRGAEFTALLLTYLFELPGRVALAREKRAG